MTGSHIVSYSAAALVKQAKDAAQRNDWSRAVHLARQAVHADPNAPEALLACASLTPDVVLARKTLNRLLRLDPAHPQGLALLALFDNMQVERRALTDLLKTMREIVQLEREHLELAHKLAQSVDVMQRMNAETEQSLKELNRLLTEVRISRQVSGCLRQLAILFWVVVAGGVWLLLVLTQGLW